MLSHLKNKAKKNKNFKISNQGGQAQYIHIFSIYLNRRDRRWKLWTSTWYRITVDDDLFKLKTKTKMLSNLNQYYQSIMIGRFSIICWLLTRRILTYIYSFQNTRAKVPRPEGCLIKKTHAILNAKKKSNESNKILDFTWNCTKWAVWS